MCGTHYTYFKRTKDWLDDRWGWVVVCAAFCNFFTVYGMLYSYGVLYIALQEEFNSPSAETAWIGSIAIGVSLLTTLVSTSLVQKLGHRLLASIGIALCVTGCVTTSFMPHHLPMYFTFGIVLGVGVNFIVITSLNLVLRYFPEKNTSRANSLALVGTTSGMLAFNPVIHIMIKHWGWRNMLRMMGGIIFIVGIPCVASYNHPRIDPFNIPIRRKKRKSIPRDPDVETEKKIANQIKETVVTFDKTIKEQLQVLLFPEIWFLFVALVGCAMTVSFYYVSFVSFMTINGFTKYHCTMVMTVIAVSEMVGKLLMSAIGDHLPFAKIFLFNIASMLGIGVMFALFFAKQLWMMYSLAIVTGMIVMTIFDVLPWCICVELFGPERTIETTTVLVIAYGIGLVMGSLLGMSVDSSGSYDSAIYACIGIYVLSIFLYTSVPIYQKYVAKDRYIMMDTAKRKRIKEENEKEEILEKQQELSERTKHLIMPQYDHYERISSV